MSTEWPGTDKRPSGTAGAFFTTYENVKATLNETKSKSNSATLQATPAPVINAVSSSAGEMVSCLLLTPAEVIKQNAQVIHNTPGGKGKGKAHPGNVTLQVLSRFRQHPWKLWSGYSALVGRNLPSTGVNFPIFEAVKGYLVERRRKSLGYTTATSGPGTTRGGRDIREEPVFERAVLTGVAASISGSIASVVTTPIDVVKTRMMLAATSDSSSGVSTATGVSRKEGNNIWAVGRRIFRKEGVRGLFRGGAIRVVWTAISFCIYLSMYEGGRFYLEKRRARRTEWDNS